MYTENNKLIAEFMGYKPAPCNNGFAWDIGVSIPAKYHLYPIQGMLITKECHYLKFNSSWDWLMPVVAKIEQIPDIYDIEEFLLIRDELCTARIEIVYTTVVDFIKWYNQQSQIQS